MELYRSFLRLLAHLLTRFALGLLGQARSGERKCNTISCLHLASNRERGYMRAEKIDGVPKMETQIL